MWTKIRDYSAALIEANPVIAFYVLTGSLLAALIGWLV